MERQRWVIFGHTADGEEVELAEVELVSTPEDVARKQLYFAAPSATDTECADLRAAGKDALLDEVMDGVQPVVAKAVQQRRAASRGGHAKTGKIKGPSPDTLRSPLCQRT